MTLHAAVLRNVDDPLHMDDHGHDPKMWQESGGKEESKAILKRRIRAALEERNERDLRRAIERFEKLEKMRGEDYGLKSYLEEMNLVEARTFFRIRTRMVKCKMNQSSDPYNRSTLWRCEDCGYVDTQSHIIHCPAYKDIRSGRSLNSDSDVVSYFSEVLKWRAANHWQVFVMKPQVLYRIGMS